MLFGYIPGTSCLFNSLFFSIFTEVFQLRNFKIKLYLMHVCGQDIGFEKPRYGAARFDSPLSTCVIIIDLEMETVRWRLARPGACVYVDVKMNPAVPPDDLSLSQRLLWA